MVTATATVNLRSYAPTRKALPRFLPLLLRVEAWLDRRASRNALYGLDERGLHDIGLTSADVDDFDRTGTWQGQLNGSTGWR
jgi:uncharacterized protein YjiS (DUF1127 family)